MVGWIRMGAFLIDSPGYGLQGRHHLALVKDAMLLQSPS